MSVIGEIGKKISGWFKEVASSKEDQIHQAHKGDKPPPKDKGGIGTAPTKVEDASKEQDWKGDT